MLQKRIIPCLLLKNGSLYKTVQFKDPKYIGDPVNTVLIFNDYEVDELIFLDIEASQKKQPINFSLLKNIANECFMPITYGGGITHIHQIEDILKIGFEKVVINSACFAFPSLITLAAKKFGSQAIVASIDVKKSINKFKVFSHSKKKIILKDPIEWAKKLEELGAGEIMLTSVNKEGTWQGYDIDLIKSVSESISIPVMVHGGASSKYDIDRVFSETCAQAAVVGSMVVYQKKGMGVLINYNNVR